MAKRSPGGRTGYKNPPRHTQFRLGQSGNPKGRPKGSKNFASVMRKVLTKRVKVTQNGAQRRMSAQEALANLLASRALAGDPKAIALLIRSVDLVDTDPLEDTPTEAFRPEEEFVLESLKQRIRSMGDSDAEKTEDAPEPPGSPNTPEPSI